MWSLPALDVEVVLDKADMTYQVGEALSGFVSLRAKKPLTHLKVSLHLGWFSAVDSTLNDTTCEQIQVFQGDIADGGEEFCLFEFIVPDGPVSYDGEVLSVEWFLRPSFGGLSALDRKSLTLFRVVNSEPPRLVDLGPTFELQVLSEQPRPVVFGAPNVGKYVITLVGSLLLFGFGALCVFAVLTLMAVIRLKEMRPGSTLLSPYWIGPLRVEVDSERVGPGDLLPVKVSFSPARGLTIDQLSITLCCEEIYGKYRGRSRASEVSVPVYRDEVLFWRGESLDKGEEYLLEHTLHLPAGAQNSFSHYRRSVRWTVVVELRTVRQFKVKESVFLEVQPFYSGPRLSPAL